MYHERRVTVVVPAYNEEALIASVLETMPEIVDCIIVVDDASTDATQEKLASAANRFGDRLRVIRHGANRGVGASIRTGYRAALQEAGEDDTELVAVMAGDGHGFDGKFDYPKASDRLLRMPACFLTRQTPARLSTLLRLLFVLLG